MSQFLSIPAQTNVPTSQYSHGYLSAEQVRNRAAVTNVNETPHERRALHRLDKMLDGNPVLRPNVPKGYYLDIKV